MVIRTFQLVVTIRSCAANACTAYKSRRCLTTSPIRYKIIVSDQIIIVGALQWNRKRCQNMVNPKEVKEKAENLEDENYSFRSFLKSTAQSKELDARFAELHNELFDSYDCCKCTNCCKTYGIILGNEELARISGFLGMTESMFFEKYLELADYDDDNQFRIRAYPCSFLLDDGCCKINECKPDVCKEYPFTNQPDRISHMINIISMSAVCPIVLEILERLKTMYGFQSR